MAFSGFGKNSGPSAQPGAQNPFGNFPRHPSPSSPLPISSRCDRRNASSQHSAGIRRCAASLSSSSREARKEALILVKVSLTDMDTPSKSSPNPSPIPNPGLHQSDADEDDENVKQLGECSSVYLALQDCLINNNRNWKSCQKEVQLLKACNKRRNN